MNDEHILAIDVGTHAVRAALVSKQGAIVRMSESPLAIQRLSEAAIYQNASCLKNALDEILAEVLENAPQKVVCAGIAAQRSSVLAFDKKSGFNCSQIYSWQNTEGNETVKKLQNAEPEIQRRSGLVLSPHYGASKLAILQKNHIGLAGPEVKCVGPLISYVLHELLQEKPYLCDESNAGRTQLWNILERRWDEVLAKYFDVNLDYLPEVQPTCSNFGVLKGLNIPVKAVCGDQNAALNAILSGSDDDKILVNLGSGGFVLGALSAQTASSISNETRLLIGHARTTQSSINYILEGTVNGCGTALSWFADLTFGFPVGQILDIASGETIEQAIIRALPQWLSESETEEVFFNSVGGIGSPWWSASVEPYFFEANTGETSADIPFNAEQLRSKALAIIESIAFLVFFNVREIKKTSNAINSIYISGGLSRLDGLCQMLADLSGLEVVRLEQFETTIIGVARLAYGAGFDYSQAVNARFSANENRTLVKRCVLLEKRLQQTL